MESTSQLWVKESVTKSYYQRIHPNMPPQYRFSRWLWSGYAILEVSQGRLLSPKSVFAQFCRKSLDIRLLYTIYHFIYFCMNRGIS